jgi:outer membrane receptor protein involved in Fe transport
MFKLRITLLLVSLSVLTNLGVHAQGPGKISGKITDGKTGETLIGASVLIDGTTKGAAANIDGIYTLSPVTAGKYSVTVKYIGYATKQISDVEVKGGDVTALNIVLDEAVNNTLKTVVIKGTFRQETINALYAQQKNSAAITDGISSEAIKRSPDKSASDVIKRISGATIQDNKFVVIRGLSDRYNTASLDGTSLPSTEPNRKAFSFDIVPSNLVENLIISKTATPNLPGDFAGGAIQIQTKDIPDKNFLTVSAAYGYNTNTTFKNFQSGYRNMTDYFAFDNGSHALPNNFPSTATINKYTNAQQVAQTRALLALNPNFNVYNANAFLNQNYQISWGHVKDVGKNGARFGAIVALTYRNSFQTIPDVGIDYHVFHYTDNRYKFSTSVGALANFAYTYGKNKITFKNIYNRIFDDQFLMRTGKNDQSAGDNNRFTAFDLVQKALYKGTIQGDHGFENNSKFTWTASYSNVVNNQPDQRKTNYALINGVYKADIDATGKQNARFFSDLNENVYAGQVDYSLPINMFKQKAIFKVGALSNYRDRAFSPRFIVMSENSLGVPYDPEFIKQLPLNQIFSRPIVSQDVYSLKDIVSASDPYKANTLTNAAYAMLDNKFGEKFRLVWGVRVEKFNLKLNDEDATTPEVKLDNLDVLPSANLTYALTSKANLRLSYSRTVGRPELRELAPFGYYDFELLGTVTGNQNLKSAHIQNLDIRYELYPSAGQIFSISAFYKNFQNPIETGIYDVNSTPDFNFFNAQKAINYGIELELRKKLDFIGAAFVNTTFYTNVAIIKSETTDSRFSVSENSNKRPMVGQAPYVINAGLMQTAYNNKLSFNLLYNRVGERIFKAHGNQFPAVYEKPRDVVDAQVGLKAFKNKGEFKLNANDILNQSTTFFYKGNTQQYVIGSNASRGATIANYKLGTNFTLSYTHNF